MAWLTTVIVLALSQTAAAQPLLTPPTDYGRSFVTTAGGAGNQPVFWIESRCRISDPATGEVRDYFQCGSCKSENTFATHDLFHEKNYDFLPVFSDRETIIFRRGLPVRANFQQIVPDSPWGKVTPLVRTAKMRVLNTPDEIVSAIEAAVPIISQTELRDEQTGRTAIIECPIKTMNMSSPQRIYQADTGPVILPDLTLPPDQWSAGLRLAFIAFNEPTWADFLVDEPTQAADGVQVHHFSRRLHFATKNVLLALDDGSLPWEVKTPKSIFNGTDLAGWDGDPRLWSVKDGVLHGETTAENPAQGNTFLIWKEGVTKDFELRLSFRCNAANNSGIQYRSKHITEGNVTNAWVVRGYQHEIRNELTLPSVAGFIYDEGGQRGRMCLVGEKAVWGDDGQKQVVDTLLDQQQFQELFRLDDWNDVVIIAQGPHIQHYLNNRLILDFTDNDPQQALREGILALQLHAGAPMWVEFRDIRIRPLE